MCKVAGNKDQEKIADLAKVYEHSMSFKRTLIRPLNHDLGITTDTS